jgi:prepilin-type N-terminal cleavage/methylation domain-containing protein
MKDILRFRRRGFTTLELLVAAAIVTVVAAVAYPFIVGVRKKAARAEATARLSALATATRNYALQHDGELPDEDAPGKENWEAAARPEAEQVWYVAIPRFMGQKSVVDFVNEGRAAVFYQKENPLYLPGAQYPESKKMTRPFFAVAMNTKLHRRDAEAKDAKVKTGVPVKKPKVKLSDIPRQANTVIYLEVGMPGEKAAHPTISTKKDYTGSCKGSAKSFVTRYQGEGLLAFVDGHVEAAKGSQLLSHNGAIIWDGQTVTDPKSIIWSPDPKDDPN